MELRQLRYFVCLAEELHFGRAAARQHIAQPAFSQQIRRLEQELGVQLFNRTSRRVELTEPGRVFVDQARGILEAASDAVNLVRQAGAGRKGRLRVAYSSGSDRGVPPKVVDRFRAKHPSVELSLSIHYDEECWVQLRSKEIDAAFFWMPLGDVEDLAWCPVVSEPLVIAVPEQHALAAISSVTPRQVAAEPLVWFARHWSPGSWDTIIGAVYRRHGLTPNVVVEEASQEGMVRGVLPAAGVTIVTASTARQLRVDHVVYRPFAEPSPTADIGLAWRADDTSPLLQSLVRIAGDGRIDRDGIGLPGLRAGLRAPGGWTPRRRGPARRCRSRWRSYSQIRYRCARNGSLRKGLASAGTRYCARSSATFRCAVRRAPDSPLR